VVAESTSILPVIQTGARVLRNRGLQNIHLLVRYINELFWITFGTHDKNYDKSFYPISHLIPIQDMIKSKIGGIINKLAICIYIEKNTNLNQIL